ncbi:MAG: response regulator [Desulfobacterales bacterium]|nr:response regulator [Desulfobacterales bacterium]
MDNGKLLLVDDEEGIRTVLGIALADVGYEVSCAGSGEEALAIFAEQNPAIVLTDIKMPGIDGIELLMRIKAVSPDTEVIMITGHGDMELAIESIKHDATDFVTKPVNPDILDIALKRAHERLDMRRQIRRHTENLESQVQEQAARLVKLERLTAVDQTVAGISSAMSNIASDLVSGIPLLEEMPCFVAIHTHDGRIVAINQLYRERLGDRVGQESCSVYQREDGGVDGFVCPVAQTFQTGAGQRLKASITYQNGDQFPVVVHTAPIRNSQGEIELVMEIAADVSGIRKLQQALETTRQRYRQLFNEAPCYIAVIDQNFQVTDTNREYSAFFGDARGRSCYRVCKQRDARCTECPVTNTFADGAGHQMETILTGANGERRSVLVRTTPLRDAAGEISQVMEMATDITELRLLQDNLSALGLMVGSVSHGVKGILTGLDAGLYLLETGREKGLADRMDRGLEKMRTMTDRIRKVVLDLLYCAKEREPHFSTVDIAALVEDVHSVIGPKASGHGILLQWEVAPDAGLLEAEEGTLHTALVAILENAVDACLLGKHQTGGHRIIFRASGKTSEEVMFEISDNGPGMDADSREKLFDLFYSSKGSQGTGLGLFLAHKAISQHRGTIDVTSEPGQGTTFKVRLPRSQPTDPEG